LQQISDLHSKFALRPLRIGEEKEERRRKKIESIAAKYNGLPYWATIKCCMDDCARG